MPIVLGLGDDAKWNDPLNLYGGKAPGLSAEVDSLDAPKPVESKPSSFLSGLNERDRTDLVNTVLAEAAGEGDDGMAGVAAVIKNRSGIRGLSPADVVRQPKQFTGYEAPGAEVAKTFRDPAARANAERIIEGVFSGQIPDPTVDEKGRGSDHYHADSVAPDWAQSMPKTAKIGHHQYYNSKGEPQASATTAFVPENDPLGLYGPKGQFSDLLQGEKKSDAPNPNGKGLARLVREPEDAPAGYGGKLNFVHAGQEKIAPQFASILTETSKAMGRDFTIQSGYRAPTHSVEAAKPGGPGEHADGTASDISMKGMSEPERQQLVRELYSRGARRFITYNNTPDMLHVDMKDQTGKDQPWFMFDKSARNMKRAPAWFQDVAANPGASLRPFNAGETRPNDDGSYSTELSTTWKLPDGRWVNVPRLWMGEGGPKEFQPDDEEGILSSMQKFEAKNGQTFQRFGSEAEAVAAAKTRSAAGGAGAGAGNGIVVDESYTPNDALGLYAGKANPFEVQAKASAAEKLAAEEKAAADAQLAASEAEAAANNDAVAQQRTKMEENSPGRYAEVSESELPEWQKQWDEKNRSSGIPGDVANRWGMGAASTSQSISNLNTLLISKLPGGDYINSTLDSIDRWLGGGKTSSEARDESIERQAATLSPGGEAARAKTWWDSENSTFGPAWSDPESYIGMLAESGPATVASMAPSGLLARGAFLSTLASGATQEVAAATAAKTATLAGGIVEGMLGGADAANSVREKIAKLPREQLLQTDAVKQLVQQGLSEDEAVRSLSEDAQTQAFVTAGVTTGMFGGMGDRALAKIIAEGVSGGIAKRTAVGAVRGAVAEGLLEEAPQGVGQTISENAAMQKVNPDQSLTEGVGEAVASGIAGGGAMGATIGGAGGAARPASSTAEAPVPAAAAPVEPPVPDTRGPLRRAADHGQERATVRETKANAAAVEAGLPVLRSTVRVDAEGIEPFMGTVDGYEGDEAIIVDSGSGEIYQVPVANITQIAPPMGEYTAPTSSGDTLPETSTDPALEPQSPMAATVTGEVPPRSEDKPAIELRPSRPQPGQRVIVDTPETGRYPARIESYENEATEAIVVDDRGNARQVPMDALNVSGLSALQIEQQELERNPPVEREIGDAGPNSRKIGARTVVLPDAKHAALYDLARAQISAKRIGGTSWVDMDKVMPSERKRIAEAFKVSVDDLTSMADDYRYRAERAAKEARSSLPVKLHSVNERILKQRQAARVKADGVAPVASTDADAAWWDVDLTQAQRKDVLSQAGVKKPDRVMWKNLTPNVRTKLTTVRDAQREAATDVQAMAGKDLFDPELRAKMDAIVEELGNEAVEFPDDAESRQQTETTDAAANVAATSPTNDLPEPTQAQKEAGNYKVGRLKLGGLDISIENPAGSDRKGKSASGKAWSVKMKSHYGYIRGTIGRDKDHIDIFVRPGTEALEDTVPVFVVDQRDPSRGRFDEHKVLAGFDNEAQARAAYLENYTKGWKGLGAITQTTMGDFKTWLKSGDTAQPFAQAKPSTETVTDKSGKQYPMKGEALPQKGLAPANIGSDGTVYVGAVGGQHFAIADKHQDAAPFDTVGFVTPDGEFLDRAQAFEWVNANEKQIKPSENMASELDALDYREQVPTGAKAGKGSSAAKKPIRSTKPEAFDPSEHPWNDVWGSDADAISDALSRIASTNGGDTPIADAVKSDVSNKDLLALIEQRWGEGGTGGRRYMIETRKGPIVTITLEKDDGNKRVVLRGKDLAEAIRKEFAVSLDDMKQEYEARNAKAADKSAPVADTKAANADSQAEAEGTKPEYDPPLAEKRKDAKMRGTDNSLKSVGVPTPPAGTEVYAWARSTVEKFGKKKGHEYLMAVDDDGSVVEFGTANKPNSTGVNDKLLSALSNPDRRIVLFHNHPQNGPLSADDISMLVMPGLHSVWSLGHAGMDMSAALTPEAEAIVARDGDNGTSYQKLSDALVSARNKTQRFLDVGIRNGTLTTDAANTAYLHSSSLIAQRAGIIDIFSNINYDASVVPGFDAKLDEFAVAVREFFNDGKPLSGDTGLSRRSARDFRHVAEVEAVGGRREPVVATGAGSSGLSETGTPDYSRKVEGWEKIQRDFSSVAATRENVVSRVQGAITDKKSAILATVPLNYFPELAGDKIPAINDYLLIKRNMDAYRSQRHDGASEVMDRWRKYISKGMLRVDKSKAQALAELMHDTTLAGIDPSVTTDEEKAKPGYERYRKRFTEIAPIGQQLFVDVKNAYREQAEELDRLLLENVRKAQQMALEQADREHKARVAEIKASDLNPIDRRRQIEDAESKYKAAQTRSQWASKARMTRMRQLFESNRVPDPYFPLARFGDYFVSIKKPKTDAEGKPAGYDVLHFSRHEKKAEKDAALKELREEFPDAEITSGLLSKGGEIKSAMDPRVVGELDQLLSTYNVSDDIRDALYQRWLETMPDLSMRKRAIHRKGTAGFNTDAFRVFASTMFHAAHQMARLKYGLELQENVNRAEEQAKAVDHNDKEMALVNELFKRHEWVKNPQTTALTNWVTSVAFIYFLGATPAAALVNASQTVMVGVPVLSAKFGFKGSTGQLLKAAKEFTQAVGQEVRSSSGVGDFFKNAGDLRNAPSLTREERAAMDAFYESGLIDRTQSHDLAAVGETGTMYNPVREKVMNFVSYGFHKVEVFNRAVTAMAAYRLAKEAGQSHLEAINLAHELTYRTHFDMSNSSRPRITQGDFPRLMTMFRSFQINMLFRLFRDIHQSVKGETKQIKKEARLQLAGVTGMMALNAGVTGTVGYGLFMTAAGIMKSLFGDDDDDPLSFEERFRSDVLETLGPQLGGIILKGAPGHYLGIDLTARIGMPDLWWRSESRELDNNDQLEAFVYQNLGAGFGMARNMYSGFNLAIEGNFERGVETASPKFIRDMLRFKRYSADGVESLRGDQVLSRDDLSAWNLASQLIGFTPAKISEAYEINNALKNAEKRIKDRKRQIVNTFVKAVEDGDEEGQEKAAKEIEKYNAGAANSLDPITSKGLKLSLKTRARNRERTVGGVRIQNEALGQYLRDQVAGAQRDKPDEDDADTE